MSFLNPFAFLLILIVIWLFKNIILRKSSSELLEFEKENRPYQKQTKLILTSLIFALLALTRPVFTNEVNKEKFDANEYIIALDASYSMQMDDIQPSRYEVAKANIISLLKENTKDRFTLIAFTKNPLLICPPTTDHNIAISAIAALQPEFILTKSTSILSVLKKVATLEQKHKALILFTDGGDEHDLTQLLHVAQKHAITVNIVAVASSKGAIIKKDNKPFKDEHSHLIISRINPILKPLASKTDGFYFEINSAKEDLSTQLETALNEQNLKAQELSTDVISYKELYYFPLLIAFIILFFALTKFLKFIPFLTILFFIYPNSSAQASWIDFHYTKIAVQAYNDGNYTLAIKNFQKLEASQYACMSIANSYYKDKQYKNSLRYYSRIQSHNKHIKSILLYNMGNAAFRLKKYQRAENYYKQSLAVEYSLEAKENLFVIYKEQLKAKVNVADMLPTVDDKKVKTITKKNDTKKNEKEDSSSSSSQQKSNSASQGGGGKKTKQKNKKTDKLKNKKNNYKMGYNAYELINKGYINETKPW